MQYFKKKLGYAEHEPTPHYLHQWNSLDDRGPILLSECDAFQYCECHSAPNSPEHCIRTNVMKMMLRIIFSFSDVGHVRNGKRKREKLSVCTFFMLVPQLLAVARSFLGPPTVGTSTCAQLRWDVHY